jgi:hypothetical protein
MTNSLTVYDYVKTASKKTPDLKTVAEQLGERFKAIKGRLTKRLFEKYFTVTLDTFRSPLTLKKGGTGIKALLFKGGCGDR